MEEVRTISDLSPPLVSCHPHTTWAAVREPNFQVPCNGDVLIIWFLEHGNFRNSGPEKTPKSRVQTYWNT